MRGIEKKSERRSHRRFRAGGGIVNRARCLERLFNMLVNAHVEATIATECLSHRHRAVERCEKRAVRRETSQTEGKDVAARWADRFTAGALTATLRSPLWIQP